jgi:molecular chaperone GrpE
MAETNEQPDQQQETPAGVPGPSEPQADPQGGGGGAQPPNDLTSRLNAQIDDLRRERDELKDKYLRSVADYQNYARRSDQNAAAARDQQLADLAKALLPVLDHFDRALEMDPQAATPQSVMEGVRIVHGELLRTLERFGVQRVDVKAGDEFDPNRHQALMRQKAQGVKSGHVSQQFQPGYVLGERTIRPAQVSVAD